MTTECVPHPEDSSRWLPVDKAVEALWTNVLAALANGESLDARLAAQRSILTDLTARLDDQQIGYTALADRVSALEELPARVAALEATVADLTAKVAALEPKPEPEPEPSGPAFGVDVSGHQTLAQVQAAAADPANAFVIVKASEGKGSQSSVRLEQARAVREAGKRLGWYHFAWPNQDAAAEAANFLAAADIKPGDVLALDVENWGTGTKPTPEMQATSWAQRLTYTLSWLAAVKQATGTAPLVYANWDWIKNLRTAATLAQWATLTSYPLWLAEWTNVAGEHSTVTHKDGSNPDSWPIVVHQYGVIGNLDRNWTPDLAKLRAVAVPA